MNDPYDAVVRENVEAMEVEREWDENHDEDFRKSEPVLNITVTITKGDENIGQFETTSFDIAEEKLGSIRRSYEKQLLKENTGVKDIEL